MSSRYVVLSNFSDLGSLVPCLCLDSQSIYPIYFFLLPLSRLAVVKSDLSVSTNETNFVTLLRPISCTHQPHHISSVNRLEGFRARTTTLIERKRYSRQKELFSIVTKTARFMSTNTKFLISTPSYFVYYGI